MSRITGFFRRWGLAACLVVLLLAAVAMLLDIAFWREPRSLTIGLVRVETPAWPKATAPLRIVLLSDLHIDHAHMPPERVRGIVQTVNALSPDLIVLAGDYVGGLLDEGGSRQPRSLRTAQSNQTVEEGLTALAGLKARYGAVAVIGNHDGWWDPSRVSALLRGDGVEVLRNSNLRLHRPSGDVWVVGMEDAITGTPDIDRALQGVPPGSAIVGVAHEPAQFKDTDGLAVLLAGHTHGGQVRLPWVGAMVHKTPFINSGFAGPVVRGGRVLVVTRGLGESGLPMRFGAPPEILVVELSHGDPIQARRLT